MSEETKTNQSTDKCVYQDIVIFLTLFAVGCLRNSTIGRCEHSALYSTPSLMQMTHLISGNQHTTLHLILVYRLGSTGILGWLGFLLDSAQYGLRSYTILVPFAFFARVMAVLFNGNKAMVFYAIRILLAFCCSFSETVFIRGTRKLFGHAASIPLWLFLLCSSGMYTASTSFVNSSLAMMSVFLSYGIWMGYENHFLALLIGAAAVVYDWPFVGVVFVPMGLHCLYKRGIVKTIVYLAIIVLIVFGLDISINLYFTHRLTIPALNIVLYNVLGIGGGPEVSLSD